LSLAINAGHLVACTQPNIAYTRAVIAVILAIDPSQHTPSHVKGRQDAGRHSSLPTPV
jgi:hypothetical protein